MRRSWLVVFAMVSACGTSTDVEGQLTISQGLYGQLTQSCTAKDCVGAPRVGTPIAWFDQSPYVNDGGVKPTPLYEGTSKANGFYEFALDSNVRGYLAIGELRSTNGIQYFTATSVLVPKGLGRLDWHAGPGNDGTWTDVK